MILLSTSNDGVYFLLPINICAFIAPRCVEEGTRSTHAVAFVAPVIWGANGGVHRLHDACSLHGIRRRRQHRAFTSAHALACWLVRRLTHDADPREWETSIRFNGYVSLQWPGVSASRLGLHR